MQIGASHPAVRSVLALQRGQLGAEGNLTVAEGLWACRAVTESSAHVPMFFYCSDQLRGPEAEAVAEHLRVSADESYEVSARTMTRMNDRDSSDGLLAIIELRPADPDTIRIGNAALVAVCDGIEQPGNLGTLIRTLDACGADALILTGIRTRPNNVKVFRASHAAILQVPFLRFESVEQAWLWLDARSFGVYLADTEAASRYTQVDWSERTAIVLGNERFGIDRRWYRAGTSAVAVPMLGTADSLNVSISAAVLLYEARSHLDRWRRESG
jgi:tRNA G18 (ribose-2'-O)-methylase SpoU